MSSALAVAERMRQFVGETPVGTSGGLVSLTTSLGVAGCDQPQGNEVESVIAAADAALYRAKRNGRNRVQGPEA